MSACRCCGELVAQPEHPLCASHWGKLPKELQKEIFKQQQRVRMGRPDATDRLAEALVTAAALAQQGQ